MLSHFFYLALAVVFSVVSVRASKGRFSTIGFFILLAASVVAGVVFDVIPNTIGIPDFATGLWMGLLYVPALSWMVVNMFTNRRLFDVPKFYQAWPVMAVATASLSAVFVGRIIGSGITDYIRG